MLSVSSSVPFRLKRMRWSQGCDLRIYELTNAVLEEFLKDRERVKALIKRLKVESGR